MIALLKYLDDRGGEPSTWAAITALFAALHVNVSSDTWAAVTSWGLTGSALLAICLRENAAGKGSGQIAQDVLQALIKLTNSKGETLKTLLFGIVIGSMMVMTSCATVPTTAPTTLASDGAKVVVVLQDLDTDAKLLAASPAVITGIEAAETAVQTGLADLTAGKKTSADFVKLVSDEVNALAPGLITKFSTNANMTTGLVLIQQLTLLIAMDAGPVTAAIHPVDPNLRTEIDVWHRSQKH